MSFCSRCGKNIPTNAKYCMHCSTPTSAPLPSKTSSTSEPRKESHIKRNMAIVALLIIVIAAFTAASSPSDENASSQKEFQSSENTPQSTTPVQTTSPDSTNLPPLKSGTTVRIGESYLIKGTEEIPVVITFDSVYYTRKISWHTPDDGYKLLVLDMSLTNIGIEKTRCLPGYYDWEVTVDKGYIYEPETDMTELLSLRPEDTKTGYVAFEILETTEPTEIRCYDYSDTILFVVDLNDQAITTKTAAKIDFSKNEIYSFSGLDSFEVEQSLQTMLLTQSLSYYNGN